MKKFLLKQFLPALFLLFLVVAWASIPQKATLHSQMAPVEAPDYEKEGGEMTRPADHFYDVRSYPDMKFDLKGYEAALTAASQRPVDKTTGGFTSVPWRLEGPTNIGGRINAIAVDPNNSNVILVGCAVGGIFKTTNGGSTWAPIFDAQNFLSIGDITFEPGSSNVIYVGTGDPNVGGYPFIGDGVYKSTDAGATWNYLGLRDTRVVSRIIVDPSNHNKIFVSTMGLPMERNNDRGLYISTNGGSTWTQSLFITNQTGIIDLVMDPANSQVLYASSWDRIRTNTESLVDGPNGKVWRSVNGGASWTAMTNGLPNGENSRVNLAIHPTQPGIVYACYVDTTLDILGIYKTNNSGLSWSPINISNLDPNALGGFGWYFSNLFIDPFQPNNIYLAGIQLWRTSDDGQTWEIVDPSWWTYGVHADKHDMAFLGPNSFLLATDGGLYKTTDNGGTFDDVDEIPNSQIYRVAVNPHLPETYTGGLQDNGTTSGNYLDPGNWPRIYGGDGFQAVYDGDVNNLIVETQNGWLSYSDDGGFSFYDFNTGVDYNDRRNWDMPIIRSSHNDGVYYTGTYRLYRNPDGLPFHYWNVVSGDLTDGLIYEPRFHTITTISESPITDQVLYVGTTDGNVSRSTDMGQTWQNISAGLPKRYITSVKASNYDQNEVFVTISGYKYNDYIPHLYRSTNQGSTWQDVSGDLPQLALNDFLMHPTADSVWVVASDGGVYATQNRGQNWARVGTEMPMCPVYDMEWDVPGHRLVAGTHARSILSFPSDSLAIPLSTNLLAQNTLENTLKWYPNPSHGDVKLHSNQPIQQWTLVDLQGRIILQGGKMTHDEALNLSGLAKGTYFMHAVLNHTSKVQKLILE